MNDILNFLLAQQQDNGGLMQPGPTIRAAQQNKENALRKKVEENTYNNWVPPIVGEAANALLAYTPYGPTAQSILGGLLAYQNKDYNALGEMGTNASQAVASGLLGKYSSPVKKVISGLENMTREQRKAALEKKAEEFAAPLRAQGFDVSVQHSGSAAGPSLYASVYDQTTKRYLRYPVRFSDHSKGPFESQFVNEASNDQSVMDKINAAIYAMRNAPKSQNELKIETEEIARKLKNDAYWQSVFERANKKLLAGDVLSKNERNALKRFEE